MKFITRAAGLALLIAAVILLGANMGLFSGQRPGNLGAKEGRLAACPDTPNCVSSHTDLQDAEHRIEPLSTGGAAQAAWSALIGVLRSLDRVKFVVENPGYLHLEFSSRLMGYVDDVEFLLDEKNALIHVRSASRLGRSDLGANRKRIESIRAALSSALSSPQKSHADGGQKPVKQ